MIKGGGSMKNVAVQICKMKESSGNEQFFCRFVRVDVKDHTSVFEHNCFQTKHFSKEECLERAWFTASFMARWVGCKMDEVQLVGFDEDEKSYITKCLTIHV